VRIFISGPSGVGKSSIIKELLKKKPDLILSVSYTTRPPRPGEKDGIDYFFVSRPVFNEMVSRGAFMEWANVHGHSYGTSMDWIHSKEREGFSIILDIDVQGVTQAKEKDSKGCFIFILPPDLDALSERLRGRGTEDQEQLNLRLENAKRELMSWKMYDYLVINDSLDRAIDEISTIIAAQQLKKEEVIGRLPWLNTIA
jgi:guanylate kinase